MSEERYRSQILSEIYRIQVINKETRVIFESGVNYRMNEIRVIKDLDDTKKKNIHNIKKVFGGIVERIQCYEE